MGIRIHTNTWRAPLQLIDSWLPAPATKTTFTKHQSFPQLVQRFARAGWLGRNRSASAIGDTDVLRAAPAQMPQPPCRVRVRTAGSGVRSDARLVISGRMADVCAELDRLAALEHHAASACA